jgi:hypothetical protein
MDKEQPEHRKHHYKDGDCDDSADKTFSPSKIQAFLAFAAETWRFLGVTGDLRGP